MPEIRRTTYIQIDNDTPLSLGIASGSLFISEVIADTDIIFGQPYANRFEVQLYGVEDVSGKSIRVYQDQEGTIVPLFKGIIDSAKLDNNGYYREIVAYDEFYSKGAINIADWWNTFWADRETTTLKWLRNHLLDYVQMQHSTEELLNDDLVVKKNIEFTSMSFIDMFAQICALSCVFPNIDREGVIQYIDLGEYTYSLSHNEFSLIHGNNLLSAYSVEGEGFNIVGEYEGQSTFEEYTTPAIDRVQLCDAEGNIVINTQGGEVPYTFTPNLFLFDKTTAELQTIADNLLEKIVGISYKPCEIKMILSNMDLQVGQPIHSEWGRHYIFNQEFSGVQLIEQAIYCKGKETAEEVSELPVASWVTDARIARVSASLDGLEVEFKDYKEGTSARLDFNDEQFDLVFEKQQQFQDQLDGKQGTYTGEGIPTLQNYPANEWTTDEEKNRHIGAMYYENETGKAYRFTYDSDTHVYHWIEVQDTGVGQAIALAQSALDAVDDTKQNWIPQNYYSKDYMDSQFLVSNQQFLSLQSKTTTIETDLDTLDGTLKANYSTTSQVDSKISQTKDEIQQSVASTYATQTSVTNLAQGITQNYYTKVDSETMVDQKLDAYSITLDTKYTTKEEFDNQKVGARNFILNSLDMYEHLLYKTILVHGNYNIVYNNNQLVSK